MSLYRKRIRLESLFWRNWASRTSAERWRRVPHKPHFLIQKLLNHNISDSILAWILNYLTDRPQYVRITSKRTISHCLQSNAGAPQGTVLALILFTCILLIIDLVTLYVLWLNLPMILLWLVQLRTMKIPSTNSSLQCLSTLWCQFSWIKRVKKQGNDYWLQNFHWFVILFFYLYLCLYFCELSLCA